MGVYLCHKGDVWVAPDRLVGPRSMEERLNKEGYFQSQIVPGLWSHKVRPIKFTVIVDDFGIKYMNERDLDHLINSLQKYHKS